VPGQEPPASVHLAIIGVGDRRTHCVMVQRMRAPALRIVRIALRPALHFADRRIEVGETLSPGAFMVSRFVEKPDRARAEAFVRGGKHLWNAGMFFFEARTMARAIEAYLPDLWRGLEEIDRAARRGEERVALHSVFPALPSVSIDHGVMEKASAVAVVPGDFGWNDVGSWESAWELSAKDESGNALPHDAVAIDASGNFVCDRTTSAGKRVYALVGVSDLILVETDDAVLLIPRDRAQDVRAVVERLKTRGDEGRT